MIQNFKVIHSYKRPFIVVASFLLTIIVLLNNSTSILKFSYPIKYQEFVHKSAKDYEIDLYLVFAIIKAESGFNYKAISRKNARGLMQISEGTGKWAAKTLEITNYSQDSLFIPEINVKIGCWYIKSLMKEFDGDLRLVLSAYNAGSGNVKKWLADDRYSKTGDTLHDIPFDETENYVKSVLEYYGVYKRLY